MDRILNCNCDTHDDDNYLNELDLIEKSTVIVIIGHSAAGKSALLEKYAVNRKVHDMDKRFLEKGITPNFSIAVDWICEIDNPKIVVLSNIEKLLNKIYEKKILLPAYIHFLYLKRPQEILLENIKKINTDGLQHPEVNDFNTYYQSMNEKFEKIADTVIDYKGNDIDEMSVVVTSAINEIDMRVFTI